MKVIKGQFMKKELALFEKGPNAIDRIRFECNPNGIGCPYFNTGCDYNALCPSVW